MQKILHRWQQGVVQTLARERRVLLLVGARQCGKTTLAKQIAMGDVEYRTLDDATAQDSAQTDPRGFVRHERDMLIIDEIQRVPALLPAIKQAVDENNRPGQYLLTGSADIQAMPAARESLAGRVAKIRLRPLSEGEVIGVAPAFLRRCFAQDFAAAAPRYSRDEVIATALRGGFPETLRLARRARARWHTDYINALLERDLKDITRIRHIEAMRELVNTLAAWSSKFIDVAAMGAKLSVRRPTLEAWMNALTALFIIERVQPWTKTDYGRVGRRKKLFMTDSGLMASILNLRDGQVRADPDRVGKLVETFAYSELSAQVDAAAGEYALYHYRDREQREIDFIIERDDGALLGVEVKAAATAQKRDFQHLAWFKQRIAGPRPFVGVLLYTGDYTGRFGDGLWALPIGGLWG